MSNATFDFDASNLGLSSPLTGDDASRLELENVTRHQSLLAQSSLTQAKASEILGTDDDDRLRGSGQNDTIDGLAGNDTLLGRKGNDKLLGRRGSDRAKGGAGSDRIKGGGGADSLLGNEGDDTLVGGSGKDKLQGGTGNDQVKTGGGRDTIVLAPGEGTDTVSDFTVGKDQIKLKKKLTFADLTIEASGDRDSAIQITSTGETLAILKDVLPSQLSAEDFGEDSVPTLDAQDDTLKVGEGRSKSTLNGGSTSLLDNDKGSLLTLDTTPVRQPEHGTVELFLDGRFVYRHDGSESLTDTFRYRVTDENGAVDRATVRIAVNPVNDAPIGAADSAIASKGGTITALASGESSVLANDTDPEQTALTAELVDTPLHASNFQLNADGSFTYTHDGSSNLSDRFTYRASDGKKASDVVTVTITVTPSSGNAPVAVDDQIVIKEGGTATKLADGSTRLIDNDTDPDLPGDVLKISAVPTVAPVHGTLQLRADGTFTYVHDGSENFTDSFVYTVQDLEGQSDTATVSITIDPVNEQPAIATNIPITLNEGGQKAIASVNLKATDVDSPPAELVYTVKGLPTHGRLELTTKPGVAAKTFTQADVDANRLVYLHDNSNSTSDRFNFELSDGGKDGTKIVAGTFNIQITPVIDLPVAVVDAISVDQAGTSTLLVSGENSVLANDTLGESDTLTAILVNQPQHGTLTLNDDGTFSYTHNGSENFDDSFTYQVTDGTNTSDPVSVAIAITPFNKAPVNLVPDQQTTEPNTSLLFSPDNDNRILISDPDAGATPIRVRLKVSEGTLTLSGVAGLTLLTGDGVRDPEIFVQGTIDSINVALDGLQYTPPRDFVGTAQLTVTTNDLGNTGVGGALRDTDTVNIIVGTASDINDAPVNTVPGNQTTPQTQNLIFNASNSNAISINDPDAGNAPVQVQLSVTSGLLSLSQVDGLSFTQGDGANDSTMLFTGTIANINAALEGLRYTPNDTFNGTATLTIRTNDQGNTGIGVPLSDQDQIAIAVTRVNRAPITKNDAITTDEGVPVNISVLSNDSDSDGSLDPTSVAIATQPQNGTVSINSTTGVITYTPTGVFSGKDTFTYTVEDNEGLVSDPATVTITVNAVNEQPVAVNDAIATDEDTAVNINVLANDTDPDDNNTIDPTTVTIGTQPANGTVTVNPTTGVVTYTPDANFNGEDTFTYTVEDADGLISDPATVTVTVNSVNDQPVAVNDAIATDEDTPVNINVLNNDTDPDGNNTIDPATVTIDTQPTNGTVTVNPTTGVVTYTPDENFNGEDTFTYTVEDADGLTSEPATVTVTVNSVNDQPVAVNDAIATDEDTAVNINVLNNDTDPDGNNTIDPTTVTIDTQPTNGTVTVDPTTGVITYTPDENFSGEDTFTYTVEDAGGLTSEPATVTVTVSPVDNSPVAVADAASTDEDTPVDIDVLNNDTDPDGNNTIDPTTVTIGTQPTNGTVSINTTTGVITYTPNANFNGEDTFTYTVDDADGLTSDPATVTITVNPVNDQPVAVDDAIATDEDTPIDINVLNNDTDPDGNNTIVPTTVTIGTQPTNGTVSVNSTTGVITYTPDADFNGEDTFTYTVDDIDGSTSAPATVTITVNPVNDQPVAVNDAIATDEDTAVDINVLNNDTDPDGNSTIDPATVTVVNQPNNGSISVDSTTGLVTYTPDADFNGQDSFTYTVDDLGGLTSEAATVIITVNPVNDQPVAVNDRVQTNRDEAVVIDVLDNDNDIDSAIDPTSVAVVNQPTKGTVVVNATTGEITYTPNSGIAGIDTFTYTVNDAEGATSNTATVRVEIGGKPVAVDDAIATDEDTPININVLANDTDPDGNNTIDPATVTIDTQPTNGTVTVNPTTGVVTYTPDANFNGEDTFTYTVEDADGLPSNPAIVTITVDPVNDQPVAVNDAIATDEDTPININVLNNDTDPDGNNTIDPATVTIDTQPTNGTVTVNPTTGVVTYTPDENFNGEDTFTYTVEDADGLISDPATVTVTVNPVNDQPVAVNDAIATDEDTPININVLNNDTDPDGNNTIDPATVTIDTQPTNGTVTVNPTTGVVTYTPDENFNGEDTFTYTVEDADGLISEPATVTVTVNPVNDQPVAVNDAIATDEDTPVNINVLANDTDPDGNNTIDATTVTIDTQPTNGTVTVNSTTGVVTYTPDENFNGEDTFTYTVEDADGLISDPATVTVTINPVNDQPVAVNDAIATDEDTPVNINVLANDTDPDGNNTIDATTVTIDTQPTNGTVTVNPTTGVVTYTPDENFNGEDTFTYTVEDAGGLTSNPATVTITVDPVNDQPVAVNDAIATDEDTPININVLNNDTDPDGNNTIDPATVTIDTQPANGTVTVNPTTGVVTYTPDENFNGEDTFTYTVDDADGLTSESATVTVTVNPVNDDPTAQDDTFATSVDVTLNGNLLANNGNGADTDPDGDALSVIQINGATFTSGSPITLPSGATLTVNADGSFTYDSNATIPENSTETDSFTYTISDGNTGTSTATANITISGSNSAPIPKNDAFETDEETAINGNLFNNNGNGIDSDPDGDSFSVTAVNGSTSDVAQSVTLPSGARVTVNADGTFDYDPNGAFDDLAQGAIATDTFTYTITDSKGKSGVATVSIEITGLNDNPIGQADTATTNEDTAITIDVLANDTDPDTGDTRQISSIDTAGTRGEIIITGDNKIFYNPRGRLDDLAVGSTFEDTFSYNIIDGSGAVSTATVTVTVSGVNDAPVVRANSVVTAVNTPITINVLANDVDVDGTLDPSTVAISANPDSAKGSVVVNANGTITYTPKPGVQASDTFTYTVRDNNGRQSTTAAAVNVSIVSVSSGIPIANADAVTIDEGETVTINLIANDIDDVAIDPASIEITSPPARGTLTLNGDGTVTYVPNDPNSFEGDGFNYRVRDNQNNVSETTTVSITVNSVNDAPVNTLPSSAATPEDTPLIFSGANRISVDDVDITNPNTTLLTVTLSVNSGRLTLGSTTGLAFLNGSDGVNDTSMTFQGSKNEINNALNGLTYTPNADFNGDVTLVITTSDRISDTQGSFGSGGPKASTNALTITVQPVNDNPVAKDDLITTDEDTSVAGDVLINNGNGRDRDPENDSLSVAAVNGNTAAIGTAFTLPSGALLTMNANGTFTYNPNGKFDNLAVGQQGTDTFEYTLSDGQTGTDTATVTITIDGRNDAPAVANNSALTVKKGSDATITTLNLSEADLDSDGADVTYVVSTSPANGRLAFSGDLATAITEFTQADIDANRVVYVHTADSETSDSFEFSMQDQDGLTSAAATFTINITTTNAAPVLDLDGDDSSGAADPDYDGRFNEGSGTVAIADSDLSITDSDDTTLASMTVTLTNRPDGNANESLSLTSAAAAIASSAGITVNYTAATGALTLTGKASIGQYEDILSGVRYGNSALNNGSDRIITVAIFDGFDTTTATSTLSVNNAPVAGDDTYTGTSAAVGNTRFTVGSRIGSATTPEMVISGSILDNDTDANNDPLTVTTVTNGTTTEGGRYTLNADGTFTYLPAVGFTGTDSFTYTVSDEFGATATGTVSITVDDLVWYVNSSAASGGTGYYNSPFKTLAQAQAAAGTGDYMYVYGGSNFTESITLENGQSLIGAGADLTVSNNRTILAATGTATITNNNSNVITLGQNNTIQGLRINGSNLNVAITDGGSSVGTLTMSDVIVNGGIRIANGGSLDVSIDSILGGSQLILQGVSGTFTASNVSLDGGNGATVQLTNNTADITLEDVDIFAEEFQAIASTNGGNLTITNGTVAMLNFGTNNNAIDISQTNNTATVVLTNLTIDANLDSFNDTSGFGIAAESSATGVLNLDISGNVITSDAAADIQVTQTGTSIFALKDFAGTGTNASAVETYLIGRNPGNTASATPGTNGFTSF